MSYIGSTPTNQYYSSLTERFNGDSSDVTFTLSRPVYSVYDIEVIVNNVQQDPFSAYTVDGTTTLTFTEAPSTGTGNILVSYKNYNITTFVPGEGTVSTYTLVDGSVTNDKLAGSISNDKLAGSISNDKLAGSISNDKLAGSITGDKIAVGTLTGNLVAAATITGDKIAVGTLTGNLVAAATITGDLFSATITTTNVNFGGATTFLNSTLESANVTTLMGANTTINISQPLVVFTANSSANTTVNFIGMSGVPVGNTATFVIINPNSATAKYINGYQVDGSQVTPKWQGGLPIGGTSANTDIYSFTVIKTSATPTYNIFASIASYF